MQNRNFVYFTQNFMDAPGFSGRRRGLPARRAGMPALQAAASPALRAGFYHLRYGKPAGKVKILWESRVEIHQFLVYNKQVQSEFHL